MKQRIFASACFFLTFIAGLSAQITNVNTKINDEQDKVTITYDLARNPKISFYNIMVKITLDGEVVNATGLSGDLGGQVTSGFGKKIVWDVTKDLAELSGKLEVSVTTDSKVTNNCMPIKTLPAYAGLGTVGVTGLGLMVGSLSIENDSKALYDTYKTVLDPNDPVYSDLSREDHYSEANKKHKTGTLLLVGGGAVIAAGGAILISRLIKINKYNKRCEGRMGYTPSFEFKPAVIGATGAAPGLGLGLSYHF